MLRIYRLLLLFAALLPMNGLLLAAEAEDRAKLAQAIVLEGEAQTKIILELADTGSETVRSVLNAWRQGDVVLATIDGVTVPAVKVDGKATRIDTGAEIDATGAKPAETTSKLRKAIKTSMDLLTIAAPDPKARASAIMKLGMEQKQEYLPIFEARKAKETDKTVLRAIDEAQAFIQIVGADTATRVAAIQKLATLKSIASMDMIRKLAAAKPEDTGYVAEVTAAAKTAELRLKSHVMWVDTFGTMFRGLSLGSILLVASLGLAITFGLMGVINMAHGEMMVVGAYTTFAVQNIFGAALFLPFFGLNMTIPGLNLTGAAYESYFLISLPLAFLTSALVGIAIERGVIRFLYKRPLESLLATWGISLVLQQCFRLMFGSNNVQVYSPSFLSGNYTFNDIVFGYNRIFVIGFAACIVLGVWLLLTKTPLGLLIRSVMQNREMAACMGVRTEWVNMMTFGLGSGLAGLAGAFLSQIGNVGPGLGQLWIVDCFMTVVVGGVGNIVGTICSALGIGVVDQTLQQLLLNPVLGKIIVLGAIILFLQWKPGGLFPTRSRSLEG